MSTDVFFSREKLSKIILSGGFLVNTLDNVMSNLVFKITSSVLYKFERKISERGAVRAGKEFTLFILNEDMSIMSFN